MSMTQEQISKYDWDRDRRVGPRDRRRAAGTRNESKDKENGKENHVGNERRNESNDIEYTEFPQDGKVYRRNGVRTRGAAA